MAPDSACRLTVEWTVDQPTNYSCDAQITGKTGAVKARKNVDGANTGIRHKAGKKFIRETGDISAGEHLKNGSTGIYVKKDATGTAKLENTGGIEAENVENASTGIIDG